MAITFKTGGIIALHLVKIPAPPADSFIKRAAKRYENPGNGRNKCAFGRTPWLAIYNRELAQHETNIIDNPQRNLWKRRKHFES